MQAVEVVRRDAQDDEKAVQVVLVSGTRSSLQETTRRPTEDHRRRRENAEETDAMFMK
jgi:hypothetical protein